MRGIVKTHAPEKQMHRLAVAVVAAVVGILAIGDALNVIYFPMYQLGLPDTALANTVVFVLGSALLLVGYRLVRLSIGSQVPGTAGQTAAIGGSGELDDRDPGQILETRYARGELTEAEFEEMRATLGDYDMGDDDEYEEAQQFAEHHELNDRETVIE